MAEAASKMSSDLSVAGLPASLKATRQGAVGTLWLARSEKRNALDDRTILGIESYFTSIADDIKVVVLAAEGADFSAGLDLGEIKERKREGIIRRRARRVGQFEFRVVLPSEVIGGGLELAAAAHVRVAERSAYYALPEASRGIFVGGGGSVRLPRLIGVARVMDMILTGRTYTAEEGQTIGLSTYLLDDGKGFATGLELAQRIASNAPLTNFAAVHMLPRIAEGDPASGFATEALMAAIAQADDEAKARLNDFLEKRGPKVKRV